MHDEGFVLLSISVIEEASKSSNCSVQHGHSINTNNSGNGKRIVSFLTWRPSFSSPPHECASRFSVSQPPPAAVEPPSNKTKSHYYTSLWNVIFEPETEEKFMALPSDTMTDMPHCIYPEGLYCALKTMSTIGHPMYVTENGIADADDTRRRYVKRGPRRTGGVIKRGRRW